MAFFNSVNSNCYFHCLHNFSVTSFACPKEVTKKKAPDVPWPAAPFVTMPLRRAAETRRPCLDSAQLAVHGQLSLQPHGSSAGHTGSPRRSTFSKNNHLDTSTGFRTRRWPLKPAEWSGFYWGEMAMDGHFRRLVAGCHVKPAPIKAAE